VAYEQRAVVDRRCGPDRRSTLDRRTLRSRRPAVESPAEHLRNGLQVLGELNAVDVTPEAREVLSAGLARLRLALGMLERN
jgi:hypothetical protein